MPIRFRCAYCNQLMGIARRKAGMVVKCPNCNGQVVVPADEEDGGIEGAEASEGPAAGTQQPLFERSDFDEVLAGSGRRAPPAAPPKAASSFPPSFPPVPAQAPRPKEPASSAPQGSGVDFVPNLPMPGVPSGIVLSPTMATLLSVAVIVALALAFTAGLIVGRLLLPPPAQSNAVQQTPVAR